MFDLALQTAQVPDDPNRQHRLAAFLQLVPQAVDVRTHRLELHAKALGDLRVGQAAGDADGHLGLAIGQLGVGIHTEASPVLSSTCSMPVGLPISGIRAGTRPGV